MSKYKLTKKKIDSKYKLNRAETEKAATEKAAKYNLTKKKIVSKYKLNRAKIEKAAKFRKAGLPLERIYAALGCSPPTYYKWMKIGKSIAEEERMPEGPDEQLCLELYYALDEACLEGELEDLKIIEVASYEDWRAAQYRLKVRNKIYNTDKPTTEEVEEQEETKDLSEILGDHSLS